NYVTNLAQGRSERDGDSERTLEIMRRAVVEEAATGVVEGVSRDDREIAELFSGELIDEVAGREQAGDVDARAEETVFDGTHAGADSGELFELSGDGGERRSNECGADQGHPADRPRAER